MPKEHITLGDVVVAAIVVVAFILLALHLGSCAGVQTVIKKPNAMGEMVAVVEINSKSDALVEYEETVNKDGETTEKVKVDNRGKPSVWETILGLIMMQTDINVGGGSGD